MSDDSFFREVDEELRQDKVRAVWTRFGTWLVGGVVAVVAVTAAYVAWEHYQTNRANAAGDRFATAVKLADDGKSDAAVEALNGVIEEGVGAYPALAQMAIGGIEAKAGHPKEAVAAYDKVSDEADAPKGLRDMASIRAGYVLVDSGSLDEVRQRVERLSGDSEPLRFPAREAIALAAWKAGDAKTAKPLLDQLVTDPGTPRDISGRARILLDLINSGATGPDALPPAKPGSAAAEAGADNGLGSVDLNGLLDTSGSSGEADATAPVPGGATMPTTDLGTTAAPAASGDPAAPADAQAAPADAAPAAAGPDTSGQPSAPEDAAPAATNAAPQNAPAADANAPAADASAPADASSEPSATTIEPESTTVVPAEGDAPPPASDTPATGN
ncbi:tetratricopeptide repeat protein [Jiella endophytica]|nr:tetratricopeptide repeat protein [Jiella endophytica]